MASHDTIIDTLSSNIRFWQYASMDAHAALLRSRDAGNQQDVDAARIARDRANDKADALQVILDAS